MHANHPASLLVAALVMLRHPCARNTATAQLLLERAAEHPGLSPAERDACRSVADDLAVERHETRPLRAHWLPPTPAAGTITAWGEQRRLNLVSSATPALKGVTA